MNCFTFMSLKCTDLFTFAKFHQIHIPYNSKVVLLYLMCRGHGESAAGKTGHSPQKSSIRRSNMTSEREKRLPFQ